MNRVGELDRGPGLCSFQNLIVWAHFLRFCIFLANKLCRWVASWGLGERLAGRRRP